MFWMPIIRQPSAETPLQPILRSNDDETLAARAAELEARANLATALLLQLNKRVLELESSMSWRVTKPFRIVVEFLQSLSAKARSGGKPDA
jgi:hypothetical protein